MYALTITEPWASLIAIGAKTIETRGWHTSYRGPVAIHASKKMTKADVEISFTKPFRQAFFDAGATSSAWEAPGGHAVSPTYAFRKTKGCVIATARLVACCRMELPQNQWVIGVFDPQRSGDDAFRPIPESELPFGHYAEGRFAWILADVVRLPDPIPAKGQLGLWEWNPPADLKVAS